MRLFPFAKEGIPFILISLAPVAGIGVVGIWVPWLWWFEIFFGLLFIFVLNFFRDPEREIPADDASIVSPADGRVIKAEVVADDRFLGKDVLKICIFMNVFNVHVNRAPASGKVTKVVYNHGKFFNASFDKASLENEQNAVFLKTSSGEVIVFNQIAGLIARRIVCHVGSGSALSKGERFGMIRFGSRVDVYMPKGCEPVVKVGDKVSAGSTVLAKWPQRGSGSLSENDGVSSAKPRKNGKKQNKGRR